MYVVVVGAGRVGSYVARVLVEQGHEVAIVELEGRLARRLDATLDALVVHGSGVDPTVLCNAGIERADLLLAVTAVDEVNLIACMTARRLGTQRLSVVARVRQTPQVAGHLALSAEALGLDALIGPEEAIATSVVEMLRYVGSGEVRELAGGRLVLAGISPTADSPLIHESLAELRRDLPADFVVVAIEGPQGVRIPGGADRLKLGERAFVLTLPESLTELAILSGQPWASSRRVLVEGCGNTGLSLARQLEEREFSVVVVERDRERCELVAGLLPRSLVLHGDGADPNLLRDHLDEHGIDAAVVLLPGAESAVLIGIFAKSLGARKVIVRCDQPAFVHLATQLGIDAVISPQRAMTDAILRFLRAERVETAVRLGEHDVEVLSFEVPDQPRRSELLTSPLRQLELPSGCIIGALVRRERAELVSGATVFQAGDQVFAACRRAALANLEGLFA